MLSLAHLHAYPAETHRLIRIWQTGSFSVTAPSCHVCHTLSPSSVRSSTEAAGQCWSLKHCVPGHILQCCTQATSSRVSSSSLILCTTASNLLPNLLTELAPSFIFSYFSIFFSYLPPRFCSSVVYLCSILSLIPSSISLKFPPTRAVLNHIFVLGFLVLHEGAWLLAGSCVLGFTLGVSETDLFFPFILLFFLFLFQLIFPWAWVFPLSAWFCYVGPLSGLPDFGLPSSATPGPGGVPGHKGSLTLVSSLHHLPYSWPAQLGFEDTTVMSRHSVQGRGSSVGAAESLTMLATDLQICALWFSI